MSDLIEMIRLVIADFEALHGPGSFQLEACRLVILVSGFGLIAATVSAIGEGM